ATGPTVTALLIGNTSNVSLNLRTTNRMSCLFTIHLRLDRSLHLCAENETDTDCCLKPLCVLETLQLSACVGDTLQSSLLIQAKIHAQKYIYITSLYISDNKTTFPNYLYQTLGSCPCNLTFRACDVRCCCDDDCSLEDLQLFASNCLLGPFGGQVSPAPDYQCSMQSSENSPDWFPFLCVTSPPENNPYLGLFYRGDTTTPTPGPSFQTPALSAPAPVNEYVQGSPVYTSNDQYFTIPQRVLGQCVHSAPVVFLENFKTECATPLQSCPTESPLQTLLSDLKIKVKNGQGGMFCLLNICENVTLALDYKFYWKGNGISSIILTRTVGTITLNNSKPVGEPNSGNPGETQDEMPFLRMATSDNNTGAVQRESINLWKPGANDGFCSTAEKEPVRFGFNSTSGCLLLVSQQNLTQCDLLRDTVASLQEALTTATYVAKSGNPDPLSITDWVNIIVTLNVSTAVEDRPGSCYGIPSHQHIHIWSLVTGVVDGIPQREIRALEVRCLCSIFVPLRFQINFTEYDCNRNNVCWPELAFPLTKYYTGELYSQSLAKGLILVFFFIAASILGTPWRQIRQAWNSAAL
uniref:Uncharacterized protein n=1 Tax=Mola mola TaxID=94237 RepID=A0A3Q3X4T2_MOLML